MSVLGIVLLVCFVVVMLLWALTAAGAVRLETQWLPFVAVLILGLYVFLAVVIPSPIVR
jgi:H+/gluconate symporter-like permease